MLHSPWASRADTERYISQNLIGAFEIVMQEEEF